MYLSPPLFPLAAFFFTGPEAYRMIPIDILLSSRLYAPLAFSILILAWSILKDDRRGRSPGPSRPTSLAGAR
jgi:hypothetical protein